MKNRIVLPALICAVLLLCSGCSGIHNKEYRFEEKYEEDYVYLKDDTYVQEVKNYSGMKSALQNLVNDGAEFGIIRTEKYTGQAEEDISRACYEISRETPMGIYAVEYISHRLTRIVSYYEIEVTITYSRPPEELANVVAVRSQNDLKKLLENSLKSFDETLTILRITSGIDDSIIESFVDEIYINNLRTMPEKPKLSITNYCSSESDIQRIVEIAFEYSDTDDELNRKSTRLRNYVYSFIAANKAENVSELCSELLQHTNAGKSGNTVYDLVFGERKAASEGFALTLKMLCDAINIECFVVEGTKDGEPYFWNIAMEDGEYYHIDLYSASAENSEAVLLGDADLSGKYYWEIEKYPECRIAAPVSEEEQDTETEISEGTSEEAGE